MASQMCFGGVKLRNVGSYGIGKLIFVTVLHRLVFNQILGTGVYLSIMPRSCRERNVMAPIWQNQTRGVRPVRRSVFA